MNYIKLYQHLLSTNQGFCFTELGELIDRDSCERHLKVELAELYDRYKLLTKEEKGKVVEIKELLKLK